jgi:hypothetical protein
MIELDELVNGLWRIEFIHEINKFLEPPYHIIMTNPWRSWGVRRKDKMAFHDQLDGIEVCLIFGQKELSVQIENNEYMIVEYDYQDPNEFDAEKIAKFINLAIS